MNIIYPNLAAKIQEKHLSYAKMAKAIGLSKSALYRRLSGQTDFKLPEIIAICQYLGCNDAVQLFLRLYTKTQLS